MTWYHEGGYEDGIYNISGNEIIVTIDNEVTVMTLDGNYIVWDINDSLIAFLRDDERKPSPGGSFVSRVRLGDFSLVNNSAPDLQRGWHTNGVDNTFSPWSSKDFTSHRYLVIELGAVPKGVFQFAWQGDGNDWGWSQTNGFETLGKTLIIDMTQIIGYEQFLKSDNIKFFVSYYNDSWLDFLPINAYFADKG